MGRHHPVHGGLWADRGTDHAWSASADRGATDLRGRGGADRSADGGALGSSRLSADRVGGITDAPRSGHGR
jgi:hypothetical protein